MDCLYHTIRKEDEHFCKHNSDEIVYCCMDIKCGVRKSKKTKCPECGNGVHGKDSLCDDHWKEYLGQHIGGRGHGEND